MFLMLSLFVQNEYLDLLFYIQIFLDLVPQQNEKLLVFVMQELFFDILRNHLDMKVKDHFEFAYILSNHVFYTKSQQLLAFRQELKSFLILVKVFYEKYLKEDFLERQVSSVLQGLTDFETSKILQKKEDT